MGAVVPDGVITILTSSFSVTTFVIHQLSGLMILAASVSPNIPQIKKRVVYKFLYVDCRNKGSHKNYLLHLLLYLKHVLIIQKYCSLICCFSFKKVPDTNESVSFKNLSCVLPDYQQQKYFSVANDRLSTS